MLALEFACRVERLHSKCTEQPKHEHPEQELMNRANERVESRSRSLHLRFALGFRASQSTARERILA